MGVDAAAAVRSASIAAGTKNAAQNAHAVTANGTLSKIPPTVKSASAAPVIHDIATAPTTTTEINQDRRTAGSYAPRQRKEAPIQLRAFYPARARVKQSVFRESEMAKGPEHGQCEQSVGSEHEGGIE